MRLFISINFDSKTKNKILAVQSRLSKYGKGRFTSADNLHITVAFLGEVPESKLDDLKNILNNIQVPKMTLRLSKIGCFKTDSELWWIGCEDNPDLISLQKELIRGLREKGFMPDAKKFKPHITLARQMHIGRLDSRDLLREEIVYSADHISLMLSHRPDGKLTYTELYSSK